MNRCDYQWCVPISSHAPHLAHLLLVGPAMAPKLCNASLHVNRDTATVVDRGYELKCRVCYAMGKKAANVVPVDNPLRTSKAVSEAMRGMFPKSTKRRRR